MEHFLFKKMKRRSYANAKTESKKNCDLVISVYFSRLQKKIDKLRRRVALMQQIRFCIIKMTHIRKEVLKSPEVILQ